MTISIKIPSKISIKIPSRITVRVPWTIVNAIVAISVFVHYYI